MRTGLINLMSPPEEGQRGLDRKPVHLDHHEGREDARRRSSTICPSARPREENKNTGTSVWLADLFVLFANFVVVPP